MGLACFRYPFRGDHRLDVVLVGGGLHLLAVWVPVLPLVVALGYPTCVLEQTSRETGALDSGDDLPGFGDPVGLVVEGVRATAVVVAYLAAPAALLAMAVSGTLRTGVESGSVPPGLGLAFLVASTATLCCAMVVASLLPAALANCAVTGRFRAAFEGPVLRRAITDGQYLVTVVGGGVVLGLGTVVAGPLNAVALGFFVAFYAELVCAALWGRAARRVLPTDASSRPGEAGTRRVGGDSIRPAYDSSSNP